MTVLDIAKKLLTYFSPEERSIPDDPIYPGRNACVMDAINAALQELFGKGGAWVRKDARGVVVMAPVTIPIAVSNGSTTATIESVDWKEWFAGCTIAIQGADVDNEIRNDSRAVLLKYPYSGPTGITTAQVFHDSITIGSDVLEVLEPVRFDRRPMASMVSESSNVSGRAWHDYSFHDNNPAPLLDIDRISESAGTPTKYFVGTWSPNEYTAPGTRMRIAPAPVATGFLDYQMMLTPPMVEVLDESDLPIPFQHVQSIFLPIAVKNLLDSPFFRGVAIPQAVNDKYATALLLLAGGNPNKTSGPRFITKG